MSLTNFDSSVDIVHQYSVPSSISEFVGIDLSREPKIICKPVKPNTSKTWVGTPPEQWGWEQLRDYVVTQIEGRFGCFPRDALKESGIFKGFVKRWGEKAGPIAIHAFEVRQGAWAGAPIGVTRFTKGNDPFFAVPILESLR